MTLLRTISRPISLTSTTTKFASFPRNKLSFSTTLKMAKQEWLVILPDKPGHLEQRMAVRKQHLDNTKPHVDSGFLVLGGATLDEVPQEGQSMKINGSVMMAAADNESEVWDWIRADVYYKSGVWDEQNIKVIPFKAALRKEL